MDVTAPAVLFPTISLLLLAYTNRFLALAALIRSLHDRHQSRPDEIIVAQIRNLRHRVRLIRDMQAFGVLSLLLCVICMLLAYVDQDTAAKITFALSLILLAISLALSIREIWISVDALNLQLKSLEDQDHPR
jgi:hypothetical protein